MKRIFSPIIALLAALLTPLHGSVTLDLGGGQATGAMTLTGGTLQASSSNVQIGSSSTLRLDSGYLANTVLLSEVISGPILGANLITASQQQITANSGAVIYSSVSGGTLNLGNSANYVSNLSSRGDLLTAGAGATLIVRANNPYPYASSTITSFSGVSSGISLVSTTTLSLQQNVSPSPYLNLTKSGSPLLPLNTGVLINPTASNGILSLGAPAITLGTSAFTTLSSDIRLIASGGTLVINNTSSFPDIYGATTVNVTHLTTLAGGIVTTSGGLVKTGAGTLTLTSGNTLNAASANTLTVLSGSSLGSEVVLGPTANLTGNGAPVPEPGSVLLLAGGVGTLFLRRWRTPRS